MRRNRFGSFRVVLVDHSFYELNHLWHFLQVHLPVIQLPSHTHLQDSLARGPTVRQRHRRQFVQRRPLVRRKTGWAKCLRLVPRRHLGGDFHLHILFHVVLRKSDALDNLDSGPKKNLNFFKKSPESGFSLKENIECSNKHSSLRFQIFFYPTIASYFSLLIEHSQSILFTPSHFSASGIMH